jgi:hypothetical protein
VLFRIGLGLTIYIHIKLHGRFPVSCFWIPVSGFWFRRKGTLGIMKVEKDRPTILEPMVGGGEALKPLIRLSIAR